jgi:hypothetical protein
MDKDTLSDVTRFAIGGTPVIDVPGVVADLSAVNASVSVDGEQVRVMALHRFIIVTAPGLYVPDPFPGIFKDPFPLSESPRGEHSPALNGGFANDPCDIIRPFSDDVCRGDFCCGRRSF